MKNQSISKENLKKIYDVACPSWQAKLEGYAKREPFSSEVELTSAEVNEMFEASDDKQTKVLVKYLAKPKTILDEIMSFEDACVKLGITDSDNEINILKSLSTPNRDKLIAMYRLEIIAKALNDGWYPNFDNDNEYKYFNYFRMLNGVFSFYSVRFNDTVMIVPSALYFKSSEIAQHCSKIAFDDYKTLYK
jgi:hypothetical protein